MKAKEPRTVADVPIPEGRKKLMPNILRVKVTFGLHDEPVLGTTPGDKELAKKYIASKRTNQVAVICGEFDEIKENDEIDAINAMELDEKTTGYPKDNGNPFFWDYQIKGFLKGSCSHLHRVPGTESAKMTAHKKVIDGLVFPQPRKIPMNLSGPLFTVQRSLRASTAQGDRIALAMSEAAPAGTWIEFDIAYFIKTMRGTILDWLDHGEWSGIGQWRNSGTGRFSYEIISETIY